MSEFWWNLSSYVDYKRKLYGYEKEPKLSNEEIRDKNYCSVERWFFNILLPSDKIPICSKCELDNSMWKKSKEDERRELLGQINGNKTNKKWNCTKWCYQWEFHHTNRLSTMEKY